MPRRELHDSDAAGTSSTVLLPGPRWLWVLANHTLPFFVFCLHLPRQKQCHSLLLQLDVTVQSHPWHKKACLRKHYCFSGAEWEDRASGGNRGAHCLSLRAVALLRCCFLLQVLPPPWARGAQPNDGKVIHHWSTTAANWISPPPINMQKRLSQGKQEGVGGGLCGGEGRQRGEGLGGLQTVGEPARFTAWGSLLLDGRWDLLSRGKSSVTPPASSADLSSAIDTIWNLSALRLPAYWQVLMTVSAASRGPAPAWGTAQKYTTSLLHSLQRGRNRTISTLTQTFYKSFLSFWQHKNLCLCLFSPFLLNVLFFSSQRHITHACISACVHTLMHRALQRPPDQ